MKLTPWYLAAIAPVLAAGCSGTMLGHFAVVAVTLGIFFGTLGLNKTPAASSSGNGSAAKLVVETSEVVDS